MVKINNIVNSINTNTLKRIELAKLAHKLGKHPLLLAGGLAGLGLHLAANAKGSKKQNQGGF
jgi:hypothetical protein